MLFLHHGLNRLICGQILFPCNLQKQIFLQVLFHYSTVPFHLDCKVQLRQEGKVGRRTMRELTHTTPAADGNWGSQKGVMIRGCSFGLKISQNFAIVIYVGTLMMIIIMRLRARKESSRLLFQSFSQRPLPQFSTVAAAAGLSHPSFPWPLPTCCLWQLCVRWHLPQPDHVCVMRSLG